MEPQWAWQKHAPAAIVRQRSDERTVNYSNGSSRHYAFKADGLIGVSLARVVGECLLGQWRVRLRVIKLLDNYHSSRVYLNR
jgi:hypothetical protein